MQEYQSIGSVSKMGSKYKPFEMLGGSDEAPKEQKDMIYALSNFQMRPCDLNDEKSQKLYEGLNEAGHNKKKKKVVAPPAEDPRAKKF